jgi:1-acyl-sn-glycerol-3-phosphate acyltransferase
MLSLWSFWVVPMIVASTVAHGLVSNVWSLFNRTPPPQLRVARAWARSLLWIAGVKVEVEGLENIRPGGNYVFVANHVSYMDTPVVLSHVPEQFLFLAKSGLFKIPFLGWHLRRAGHVSVPLDDTRGALRTLQQAAGLIRDGRSTLVFPEGGRSETGELCEFRDGAAFIAIRAQVPLVPVALIGMRRILPMHTLHFRRGRVKLRIGQPIPTKGLTIRQREELTARARAQVVELLGHQ